MCRLAASRLGCLRPESALWGTQPDTMRTELLASFRNKTPVKFVFGTLSEKP